MGRGATKASGNVWFEARIEAAKYNDRLSSRAGAAELLNLSEDAVKSAELGLYKAMPVDNAVLMADLYNAPELLNYYCLNECPIGRNRPVSSEVVSIDRVTIKLFIQAFGRNYLNEDEYEDERSYNMNSIAISGRLTRDPDLRRTQDGTQVCRFSVAVDRPNVKDKTDYIDCVAWRNRAEFVSQYFKKSRYTSPLSGGT